MEEIIEDNLEDNVTFEDLGLDENTLKAIEKKGFVTPSPIQILAIPRLLNGESNLIARARTGTGKTAAFGLPIIQNIKEKTNYVQALILEPTRELAMQTSEEMKSFCATDFPRTTVLYGGASYATQIRDLKKGSEIVVGTPGRIKDHIDKKTLDISKIKYFILDEGDEMLDMGFIDDIREIFEHANIDSRILLFSATMPSPILKIASDFMGEYEIIEEENVVDEALLIDQKIWYLKENDKVEALVRLIDMSPDFYGLVFTMTKNDADRVTRELDMRGYEADALHGDIMQNQREKVLERFRLKKTRILVATDVAARGIDISGLSHVVNFSLPFDTATYVHRIGRTGRAGTTGTAITFVRPEERRKLQYFIKNVQRATKAKVEEEKVPTVNAVLSVKEERLIEELKEKLFVTSIIKNQIETQNEDLQDEETQISSDAENCEIKTNDEVLKATTENITTELKLCEIPEKFLKLASELSDKEDSLNILAGVLSIMYGEKLSPKHYGRISSLEMGPSQDQMRIFVSLGKQNGYRAKEIADYFSKLLHIPGRLVDDIDVAQQFSLVSLPIASAKKAIEMSKSNKKLPHMHLDAKEEGNRRRHSSKTRDFERDDKRKTSRPYSKDSKRNEGRKKGDRPNVHTSTQRKSPKKGEGKNVGAAGFVKKGAKK